MKFLSIRDLRNYPGRVWESLQGREVVLTANGKPVAVLVGVEEDELEQTLILLRRVRSQSAVSRMRAQAAKTGLDAMSTDEIDADIRAARSRRKSS